MPDKNGQQNAAIILNNLHNITIAILNRYDFGETGDLNEFAKVYCERYIQVYNEVEALYTKVKNQKVKINASFQSSKE